MQYFWISAKLLIVFYSILLDQMSSIQLNNCVMIWVSSWLTGWAQGVRVIRLVATCHWWGSTVLHPCPALLNINKLVTGLEGTLSILANDTKSWVAVDSLQSRKALQRGLDKLEKRATTRCMKFNKGQILYWDRTTLAVCTDWGIRGWRAVPRERDLGILDNGKWNLSQQCPGSQERQPCPGGHQPETLAQVKLVGYGKSFSEYYSSLQCI